MDNYKLWGFQDSQFNINFCESETCQCNVQLEIQKEASIVAGDDGQDEAVDGDRDDDVGNRNCNMMQCI